ncbi:hypothetical protein [Leptospirillum ferriphilum]|jgi:hypothetical protein|uniref:Uncharacterized protein n=1 Tax=Leptospirillum ferriphilum TaxID=178606 RepID=A0A1V3SXV8_9BACT|nr:hypothetical protein [Leptospirillum ferriphilum]OOH73909.1 hypothetical protein BOX24_02625 [Leptospirillum ferriphilum]OOH81647.1 hypothetical protein BOX30_04920 [Leptospirillum ferriphilum]
MRTEHLQVYPEKKTDSREKTVLLLFFAISAFFIGLFSLTRLFLIHWVWLVPLSLGSLVLFMVAVLYFRIREKPLFSLWIENDTLCVQKNPGLPGAFPERYFLSMTRMEPEDEEIPKEIRIFQGNEPLVSFSMLQVRDVTLYREIAHLLQRPPDIFSSAGSDRPEKSVKKGKFFWVVLPWAMIVLLMAAWEIYENHLAPRNYGPFSNP